MQVSRQRIRFAVDISQMGNILDVITGATPQFWNGTDVQFELAFFYGNALLDVSNLSEVRVDLKSSAPRTGVPLMSSTLAGGSLNAALTLEDWKAGDSTDCHALVSFTQVETALKLEPTATFWLVISALTNDSPSHQLVLGATPLNV